MAKFLIILVLAAICSALPQYGGGRERGHGSAGAGGNHAAGHPGPIPIPPPGQRGNPGAQAPPGPVHGNGRNYPASGPLPIPAHGSAGPFPIQPIQQPGQIAHTGAIPQTIPYPGSVQGSYGYGGGYQGYPYQPYPGYYPIYGGPYGR